MTKFTVKDVATLQDLAGSIRSGADNRLIDTKTWRTVFPYLREIASFEDVEFEVTGAVSPYDVRLDVSMTKMGNIQACIRLAARLSDGEWYLFDGEEDTKKLLELFRDKCSFVRQFLKTMEGFSSKPEVA